MQINVKWDSCPLLVPFSILLTAYERKIHRFINKKNIKAVMIIINSHNIHIYISTHIHITWKYGKG